MTLSLTDAKSILETPKRLTNIHEWSPRRNREGRVQVLQFEARIEINGVLPRGVWFRSIIIPQYPDTAKFQLDCDQPSNRSHIPLYRLEWRPFGGHTNGQNGPEELRGLYFPAGITHEHCCLASNLEIRIDLAISRLMATKIDEKSARISVPVLYPSGSGSAVEITINGDKCFVSDIALGHIESELHGAQEFYDHSARSAAARFGVCYDGLSVSFWASLGGIEGAITAVANASVYAATIAIYRAVQEKEKQKNVELYEKVASIFGHMRVAKKAELGGRDTVWDAHNVVMLADHHRAVFEFVSENSNSISNKFMMFSDLSKIEGAFSLNSVVKSVEGLGGKGAMLADISNMIPLSAPDADFKKYARAA